jgi:hypothetical protein
MSPNCFRFLGGSPPAAPRALSFSVRAHSMRFCALSLWVFARQRGKIATSFRICHVNNSRFGVKIDWSP